MSEEQTNFADQLDPKDVQSVSSNGVTVNLRTNADKKAEIEAENLAIAQNYHPLKALFGASKWGSMRR